MSSWLGLRSESVHHAVATMFPVHVFPWHGHQNIPTKRVKPVSRVRFCFQQQSEQTGSLATYALGSPSATVLTRKQSNACRTAGSDLEYLRANLPQRLRRFRYLCS